MSGDETMHTVKISPAGFTRLKKTLQRYELEGYSPDDCAKFALNSVGLPHRPTKLVVDYSLDGPIFPFMDWPK